MYNLFTTYYKSKNKIRQQELDFCISDNCNNSLFKNVYVFTETYIEPEAKMTIVPIDKRPTYENYFEFINSHKQFKNYINIIANTDIVFDKTLLNTKYYFCYSKDIVLALSKYDYETKNLDRKSDYSQDVWIFNGQIKKCNSDIMLGEKGCDNRIAYELNEAGYFVMNPSSQIKIYHVHQSNYRTYKKNFIPTGNMMNVKVM